MNRHGDEEIQQVRRRRRRTYIIIVLCILTVLIFAIAAIIGAVGRHNNAEQIEGLSKALNTSRKQVEYCNDQTDANKVCRKPVSPSAGEIKQDPEKAPSSKDIPTTPTTSGVSEQTVKRIAETIAAAKVDSSEDDITRAVMKYVRKNTPQDGKTPTKEEVRSIVQSVLDANPPTPGEKGDTGRGITGVRINDAGELILTFSKEPLQVNLGNIRGPKGKQGEKGEKGSPRTLSSACDDKDRPVESITIVPTDKGFRITCTRGDYPPPLP